MADLDGDEHLDIVTDQKFDHYLTVLFGTGDGGVIRTLAYHPGFRATGQTVTAVDLDADGNVDLIPNGGPFIHVNCSQ